MNHSLFQHFGQLLWSLKAYLGFLRDWFCEEHSVGM